MNGNESALETLKLIIGEDHYDQVCGQLAGKKIYIPQARGKYPSTEERNKAIRKDMWQGMGTNELANKYHLSVPRIYAIIEDRG